MILLDINKIEDVLRRSLSEKRFNHSIGVRDEAKKLAVRYNADPEKAYIAGLVHDCCKTFDLSKSLELCRKYDIRFDEMTMSSKPLIHAPLGAEYARREFDIDDREILDSIAYHTTGRADMTMLDKIIYISDYIEPTRSGYWLPAMRLLAYDNIDDAVRYGLHLSIVYVMDKNEPLHIDTINARNQLLMEGSYVS